MTQVGGPLYIGGYTMPFDVSITVLLIAGAFLTRCDGSTARSLPRRKRLQRKTKVKKRSAPPARVTMSSSPPLLLLFPAPALPPARRLAPGVVRAGSPFGIPASPVEILAVRKEISHYGKVFLLTSTEASPPTSDA